MIGNITEINRRRPSDMIAERIDRQDKADENNDGILTADEIDQLISNIGEDTEMQMDREQFISQLDRNGNAEIEGHLFSRLDENNSKDLSTSELQPLVDRVNERTGRELTAEELTFALDSDGDGLLTKEEAVELRDLLGSPQRPPRHRTLDAIKTYGEIVAAESEDENQPPTIVVPV